MFVLEYLLNIGYY